MNTKSIKEFAFDAFRFVITVGIWGFVIAIDAMKWVAP